MNVLRVAARPALQRSGARTMASWRTLPWETEAQALSSTEKTAMMVAAGGVSFAAIAFVVGTFGDPMPHLVRKDVDKLVALQKAAK